MALASGHNIVARPDHIDRGGRPQAGPAVNAFFSANWRIDPMKRFVLTLSSLLVVCVVALTASRGDDAVKKQTEASHPLVGTWKLVSAKYGGQEFQFPAGLSMVKHVTPEQFMWARYDAQGEVIDAAGGTYSMKDGEYAETPIYGMGDDFGTIKGKSHPFKWKVDGKRWLHNGKLDSGLTIEEVWERVENQK